MNDFSNSKVIVYGKPSCPYCERAKAMLHNHKAVVEYIDLNENQTAFDYIKSIGCETVPQIFIDDAHIGGHDDLIAFLGK